jgi:hypothetical protein
MTARATDNFNRANGALGANWTGGAGEDACTIVSNLINFSGGNGLGFDQASFFSGTLVGGGTTWPNDQYSKGTVGSSGAAGADQGPGLLVRHAAAAQTFYRFSADQAGSNNVTVSKFVSATYTSLGAVTHAWTTGAIWEIDAQGTTLTIKESGSTVTTKTDSAITAGNPGISYSSTDTGTNTVDDWEGGDFVGGAPAIVLTKVSRRDAWLLGKYWAAQR